MKWSSYAGADGHEASYSVLRKIPATWKSGFLYEYSRCDVTVSLGYFLYSPGCCILSCYHFPSADTLSNSARSLLKAILVSSRTLVRGLMLACKARTNLETGSPPCHPIQRQPSTHQKRVALLHLQSWERQALGLQSEMAYTSNQYD